MEPLHLNISYVQIIVHKTEKGYFNFINPSRSHDGFVLFTEGKGWYNSPTEAPIELSRGSLVLLRRGDAYRFHFPTGCSYVTSAYLFGEESCEALGLLRRVYSCTEEVITEAVEMARLWQRRLWDSEIRCVERLYGMYRSLLSEMMLTRPTHTPAVERALEFIHANFKSSFTSAEIASYCSVSPSYLRAVFAEEMKMNITEYRNTLRLSLAKEMLDSGVFTVKEISAELGFCDVYYFSRFFKTEVGMAPIEYKKRSALGK